MKIGLCIKYFQVFLKKPKKNKIRVCLNRIESITTMVLATCVMLEHIVKIWGFYIFSFKFSTKTLCMHQNHIKQKNANIGTQKNIVVYKLTTKWKCDHVFIISIYCVVWCFNITEPSKTFFFGSPCIMCNEISIVI